MVPVTVPEYIEISVPLDAGLPSFACGLDALSLLPPSPPPQLNKMNKLDTSTAINVLMDIYLPPVNILDDVKNV